MAQALALGLFLINFAIPGSSGEAPVDHKNWSKVKRALRNTADSALTLVPPVTALVIPRPRPVPFAVAAAGVWALGVGVAAIPKDGDASKPAEATADMGVGLQKLGTALAVGALVAYCKNMGRIN